MVRLMLSGIVLTALVAGCSSGPTARHWRESEWTRHEYKEVAEITRAVLADSFKFQPVDWRWYKDDAVITFSTEWNDQLDKGIGFSGTGKRYRVFVEAQEQAVDLFRDSAASKASLGSPTPSAESNEKLERIEVRNGVVKRIVTQLAIAVERQTNINIREPDNPKLGTWRADGESEEMYYRILERLKDVLTKTGGRTIDISPRLKNAHDKYFDSANMTPAEREQKYGELEKRPWRDQPPPKE